MVPAPPPLYQRSCERPKRSFMRWHQ